MNLLYFGSGRFSKIVLENFLKKGKYNDINVVYTPVTPKCEFETFLFKNKEIKSVPCDKGLKNFAIPQVENSLGVVVSFGQFIPSRLIRKFTHGMINVHPSMLPRYRGSAPIERCIMNGDNITATCIIDVHPKTIDAGDVYCFKTMDIDRKDSFETISDQLAMHSADLLANTLRDFHKFKAHKTPQSEIDGTFYGAPEAIIKLEYAKKLYHNEALICLDDLTAESIYNLHRAISHRWRLIVKDFMIPEIKLVTILDPLATPFPIDSLSYDAGCCFFQKKKHIMWLRCKDSWLPCTEFRIPNKSHTYKAYEISDLLSKISSSPMKNLYLKGE